jgi:hypothetical protein
VSRRLGLAMVDMTDDEEEAFMSANMAKIFGFCRQLRSGEITRDQCMHKLLTDCKVAYNSNVEAMLDIYDPSKP